MAKLIQYSCADSFYDGPFDHIVGWRAASMGYAIKTDAGHLIVIDGGNLNDAEGFLSLLEELSDGQKPTVDLWFITHPHGDHYFALRGIAYDPQLAERVSVKKLIYKFPEDFCASEGRTSPCVGVNRDLENIAAVFGAETHTPQRDEHFVLDDVDIRMLYTPDDCSIFRAAELNYISLIFAVKGKEKQAIFTGDASHRTMAITRWRYPSAILASHYLQLPHHGLCDAGCMDFYKAVNAKEILLPSCIAGDRAMASDYYYNFTHAIENRWAIENAEHTWRAYEGRAELDL